MSFSSFVHWYDHVFYTEIPGFFKEVFAEESEFLIVSFENSIIPEKNVTKGTRIKYVRKRSAYYPAFFPHKKFVVVVSAKEKFYKAFVEIFFVKIQHNVFELSLCYSITL